MKALVSCLQGVVNVFFSARFRVEGDSMLPSLRHGESVLVVRTRFRWNRLRRGDVAVFERPGGGGVIYIKRVVGLPGEDIKIAGGRVYLDGNMMEEAYIQSTDDGAEGGEDQEWFNGADEYFLLGDNRASSADSRAFGPVSQEFIRGRAWFRCWPPRSWRPISRG